MKAKGTLRTGQNAMLDTTGLLEQMKHHDRLPIMLNENCQINIPEPALATLLRPHRLSFYYFVYVDQGSETYTIDMEDVTISGNEMVFGLPNQIFRNPLKLVHNNNYKLGFDEHTLAMLPGSFPFLLNPLHTNVIRFEPSAKARVKSVFSNLFQLLHAGDKPQHADIILAHLHTLLTEINSAYFSQADQFQPVNPKLNDYVAFKLAVEADLSEQHDIQQLAEQLNMTAGKLYSIVKEQSGLSPKAWITKRIMLEAQRKLQYSDISVKALAYELGFNDPAYFSRLFRKSTGMNISAFLKTSRDLSNK